MLNHFLTRLYRNTLLASTLRCTRFKINHTINYVLPEKKPVHIFIKPSTTKGIAMNIKEDILYRISFRILLLLATYSIESSIVCETYIHEAFIKGGLKP
jgi:hypothetical protein